MSVFKIFGVEKAYMNRKSDADLRRAQASRNKRRNAEPIHAGALYDLITIEQ